MNDAIATLEQIRVVEIFPPTKQLQAALSGPRPIQMDEDSIVLERPTANY
jgi:hypothetical protein